MRYLQLQLADQFVTLEAVGELDCLDDVVRSLGDLPYQDSDQALGTVLQIELLNEDTWILRDLSDDSSQTVTMPGDLAYFLSDKIIHHFANLAEGGHCLHAACVAKGDNALIIPANSGQGKSTLTCWLLANGFDYVTDELVFVDDHGVLQGVPRLLQIKPTGTGAVFPLMQDSDAMIPGAHASGVPARAFGASVSDSSKLRLKAVLFPSYSADFDYCFEPVTRGEAAMQLMGTHVNARNLDAHGFRAMSQLAREVPGYKLEYGGFDCLPEDYVERLQELLAK